MNYLSQYENKQHGTHLFPVAYYDINPNHHNYIMPFHWHKERELIHIRKGNVIFHFNDCVYIAHEGDIFLIPGNMLHGSLPPEDVLYDCFVFDFYNLFHDHTLLQEDFRQIWQLELIPNIYYPKETNADIYPYVTELMDVHREYEYHPNDIKHLELITATCLLQLFCRILKNNHYSVAPSDTIKSMYWVELVKKILEYVESNYKQEITLNDLAKIVGMNPRYLCRIFKRITAVSPIDYVVNYRIEQACKFLLSTSMPITNIGFECGFKDTSYFSRIFKLKKGMTPRQYRLQFQKSNV